MISTECFQQLNIFYDSTGLLVPDLRPDGGLSVAHNNANSSKIGFFSKFFRRKVSFALILAKIISFIVVLFYMYAFVWESIKTIVL